MAETVLLTALRDYRRQLEEHLTALRDRHEHLERAWVRLRDIYEGEGAQVFAEAFDMAAARLADYTSSGSQIARQLESRIEELRQFESAGGPEI
jgi:uncharacterized protein YukE